MESPRDLDAVSMQGEMGKLSALERTLTFFQQHDSPRPPPAAFGQLLAFQAGGEADSAFTPQSGHAGMASFWSRVTGRGRCYWDLRLPRHCCRNLVSEGCSTPSRRAEAGATLREGWRSAGPTHMATQRSAYGSSARTWSRSERDDKVIWGTPFCSMTKWIITPGAGVERSPDAPSTNSTFLKMSARW